MTLILTNLPPASAVTLARFAQVSQGSPSLCSTALRSRHGPQPADLPDAFDTWLAKLLWDERRSGRAGRLRATRRRVGPIAQAPPPRLAAGELPDVEMLGLEMLWGLATSLFDLAFRPGHIAPWRRQQVCSSAAPRARTRGGDASAPPVPLPGRARSTPSFGIGSTMRNRPYQVLKCSSS